MNTHPKKTLSIYFYLIKADFFMLIIPALLWLGATHSRSFFIEPRCTHAPQSCTRDSILSIDQLSIGMEDSQADEYSYFSQNVSGLIALTLPVLIALTLLILGKSTPLSALIIFGTDLVIVLQTAAWNGLFTEISHLIVQRPRPFVYLDPVLRGTDSAHYTSFYSGHTSYTAAMMTVSLLLLLSRRAPAPLIALGVILAESFIFSTGHFRILAGRHFLTDVICGAIAGTFVAWMVVQFHRKFKSGPNLAGC